MKIFAIFDIQNKMQGKQAETILKSDQDLAELKIPDFLKDDPEESQSYEQVAKLGKVLQNDAGRPLTQDEIRTHVLSKMFDMPDEPQNQDR